MQITKRVMKDGNLVAVMVTDGDISYPILVEGLHIKIVFDNLVESGYEFCGLPFDFRKNGITLDQLPAMDYNLTSDEEQDMYDMLENEMYTQDELKQRLVAVKVSFIPEPEAKYIINTREDFLKFLTLFNPEDDKCMFTPLNYFVAPTARFTVEEYMDPKNVEWIEKLNLYRQFPYKRWIKFLAWAKDKNISTYSDILRLYYRWGLDGLNLPLINERERLLTTPEDVSMALENRLAAMFTRKEIGLIDRNGTVLVPEESKGIKWEFVNSREYVQDISSGLLGDATDIVELKTYVKELQLVKEGLQETLKITTSRVTVGKQSYMPLRVYPNSLASIPASPTLWTPDKVDLLAEEAYMQALARDTLRERVAPCSASSIKALELTGMSRGAAVRYIVHKAGLDSPQSTENGTEMVTISDGDIQAYGDERLDSQDVKEAIEDIIDGNFNIDGIAACEKSMGMTNIRSIYNKIYVMHRVFGIPLDEIKEKIRDMGDSESFTVTGEGTYKYTFKQPLNKDMFKAFYNDVQRYRVKAASEAVEYVYVTDIMRELGSKEADRHVGLKGYVVNATSSAVKMILSFISEKYRTEVLKIPNEREQAVWLKDTSYFAATRFFEVALKGTLTMPKALGGATDRVDTELVKKAQSKLCVEADILTAVCEANFEFPCNFRYFFANAYVSATKVIPIKNTTIQQHDCAVSWLDLNAYPEVMQKYVAMGAIPPNYQGWEMFACDYDHSITYHSQINTTDLYYYYKQGTEYRKGLSECEPLTAAPHPTEYLYPGFYHTENADNPRENIKLRDGEAKWGVIPAKNLTMKDFEADLDISEDKEIKTGFKLFTGLSSEDFYMMPDLKEALCLKISREDNEFTVCGDDKFYANEEGPLDYHRITEFVDKGYPILNIWGRTYILRESSGKYYRVEV